MSTRSTSSNLFSPLRDPESLIRRRNLGEPSSLFDFEEVMSIPHNNMGPPPVGPPPPNNNGPPSMVRPNGKAPRLMEELPGDDANRHIDKYLEITQHMKQNGISDDTLRLSLSPYSLTHHAITWYDRLPRNSIHSFDDMMRKFLSKYFPPTMVTKLRNEITKFEQKSHESLFEAWERYKLSIDRCPNYNMLLVTQIDTFYNGLTLSHRDTINAAAGGTFMQKTPKECYELIENMTAHHNHWDTSATRDETSINISSTPRCLAVGGYIQEAAYAASGELKSITTRNGVSNDGLSIPIPPPFINLEENEREAETSTDPIYSDFTIKVPTPLV
ncbi:reverse transcriptase domain-containing protein [Tanacetum coccineum]